MSTNASKATILFRIFVIASLLLHEMMLSRLFLNQSNTDNNEAASSNAIEIKNNYLTGSWFGLRGGETTSSIETTTVTTDTTEMDFFPNWNNATLWRSPGHHLVSKGHNFVADARRLLLEDYLEEFLTIYKNRPDKVNMCGIRFNHAYALWLTVKILQPATVIESGVNAGQSTYFIRQASPTVKIMAFDPLAEPICNQGKRYIDTVNSEYYTGDSFMDITAMKWTQRKDINPKDTLVFLDDHLRAFDRFGLMWANGFRHFMVEDNYKHTKGATNMDKAGYTPKQMLYQKDNLDTEFFFDQLVSYAEFPPLVHGHIASAFKDPVKEAGGFLHPTDKNDDMVPPLLRPDLSEADKGLYLQIINTLGIADPACEDLDSYMQVMNYNFICYFELKPLSPYLFDKLKSVLTDQLKGDK